MEYEVIVVEEPWKAFNMSEKEYMTWMAEGEKDWCHEHDGAESYYHKDGEQPMPICPHKHHYHCEQCGLLTQIG